MSASSRELLLAATIPPTCVPGALLPVVANKSSSTTVTALQLWSPCCPIVALHSVAQSEPCVASGKVGQQQAVIGRQEQRPTVGCRRCATVGAMSPRRFVAVNAVAAAVLALRAPPELRADSNDYLRHLMCRPPLPALLYDVARLFGPLQLRAAVTMQMAIGVVAAYRLARAMMRAAALESSLVATAIFYVLFAPQLKFGIYIMSDSLAYAMVSLAVAAALDCVRTRTPRSLLACTGWTIVAVATRAQLLFLVPALVAGVALFVWRAPDRRRALRPAALALGLLVASSLIQPTYNYVFNGRFLALQTDGIHLVGVAMYVSERRDVERLPAGPEREFALDVFDQAARARLLRFQAPPAMQEYHHFDRAFDELTWAIIGRSYGELVLHRSIGSQAPVVVAALSPDEFRAFDRFMRHIALGLLAHNWPRYVAHVAICAHQFAAVTIGIAAAMLLTALFGLRAQPARAALLGLVAALWLANLLVIGLVQDYHQRYTFPFDLMLIAATVVSAWSFVRADDRAPR
jgi:hypothetical protein